MPRWSPKVDPHMLIHTIIIHRETIGEYGDVTSSTSRTVKGFFGNRVFEKYDELGNLTTEAKDVLVLMYEELENIDEDLDVIEVFGRKYQIGEVKISPNASHIEIAVGKKDK